MEVIILPRKTPADVVIEAFGGVHPTSRAIGVSASWVCRWRKAKDEYGTGGEVPGNHHKEVLAAAERLGVQITPYDLIYGRR